MRFSHDSTTHVTIKGLFTRWILEISSHVPLRVQDGSLVFNDVAHPAQTTKTGFHFCISGGAQSCHLPSCFWSFWPIRRSFIAREVAANKNEHSHRSTYVRGITYLFSADFLEFTIKIHELKNLKQKDLRRIAGHSRPASRFKDV